MKNISFSFTTPQFRDRSKTVTRRLGWWNLKHGDQLMAVEKAMGLKKGEKIKRLGMIEIVSVRTERLSRMTSCWDYGLRECRREGFPDWTPDQFVHMFTRSARIMPDTEINRIEFRYLPTPSANAESEAYDETV